MFYSVKFEALVAGIIEVSMMKSWIGFENCIHFLPFPLRAPSLTLLSFVEDTTKLISAYECLK